MEDDHHIEQRWDRVRIRNSSNRSSSGFFVFSCTEISEVNLTTKDEYIQYISFYKLVILALDFVVLTFKRCIPILSIHFYFMEFEIFYLFKNEVGFDSNNFHRS